MKIAAEPVSLLAMKTLLAQINTTITDFEANIAAIAAACDHGRELQADVVLTPELAVLGYPPLDLLENPQTMRRCQSALPELAAMSQGLTLVAGIALPSRQDQAEGRERPAMNAAVVFTNGEHVATIAKRLLPSYDVFDEDRYFQPGAKPGVVTIGDRRIGITVCEDIWNEDEVGPTRYDVDPVAELAAAGVDGILNLSASPFDLGKAARRVELVRTIAVRHGLPIAYCNLVGGNDSLVFDGRSFALDGTGALLGYAAAFEASELVVTLPRGAEPAGADEPAIPPEFAPDPADEARAALVLGVADYMRKCGFSDAVIGLSGGIDSAVVAAIAVEALGAEHVTGVAMPGPYSSEGSVTDAVALAKNLGIRCPTVPIGRAYEAFKGMLSEELARPGRDKWGVTDQNIQARARGVVLMAMSNHFGTLLLTTGNKSEMAVGYCTLYGDMNGGLAVIGDLPKLLVYDVARSYNRDFGWIPTETIEKPPSAELAPDQKDSDSLPPYPVLDKILERHVVQRRSVDEIVELDGFAHAVVSRIVRLVERNEYKRRQAAPILRVTRKAFGGGRRIPMARAI